MSSLAGDLLMLALIPLLQYFDMALNIIRKEKAQSVYAQCVLLYTIARPPVFARSHGQIEV